MVHDLYSALITPMFSVVKGYLAYPALLHQAVIRFQLVLLSTIEGTCAFGVSTVVQCLQGNCAAVTWLGKGKTFLSH